MTNENNENTNELYELLSRQIVVLSGLTVSDTQVTGGAMIGIDAGTSEANVLNGLVIAVSRIIEAAAERSNVSVQDMLYMAHMYFMHAHMQNAQMQNAQSNDAQSNDDDDDIDDILSSSYVS